jgi:hypothetical protein
MLAYLAGWFAANAGVRQLLERLAEERGTGMALTLPENAHSLVELITRTRRLGFSIYWWEVQNAVMAAPNRWGACGIVPAAEPGRAPRIGGCLKIVPIVERPPGDRVS